MQSLFKSSSSAPTRQVRRATTLAVLGLCLAGPLKLSEQAFAQTTPAVTPAATAAPAEAAPAEAPTTLRRGRHQSRHRVSSRRHKPQSDASNATDASSAASETTDGRTSSRASRRSSRHASQRSSRTTSNETSSEPVATPAKLEAEPPATSTPQTVSILTGGLGSTSSRIAADMSAVLDTDHLRVMPVLGKTSAQNLEDLSRMPNIDLAIVRADALQASPPDVRRRISYVTPLFAEEIHVLAAPRFKDISQLAGQTVAMTGTDPNDAPVVLFRRLNISVVMLKLDESAALAKLQAGEVAAIVSVSGKPAQALSEFKNTGGFRLLPIPYSAALQDVALPAKFSAADYPNFVAAGSNVDTVAVTSVLAIFDAPKGTPRFRRLADFTSTFFQHFSALRDPDRHPKWRDVNLAATVPGWHRFAPAQDELAKPETGLDAQSNAQAAPSPQATPDQTADNSSAPPVKDADAEGFVATSDTPFDRFIASKKGSAAGPDGENLSHADQDQLLKEFKIWNRTHRGRSH